MTVDADESSTPDLGAAESVEAQPKMDAEAIFEAVLITPPRPSPWLSTEANILVSDQRAFDEHDLSFLEMHDQFEQEEPDSAWAPLAEQLLMQYLGAEAAQEGHELVGVWCRQTLCEIEMRSSAPEARNDLYRLMSRIYNQSWSDGLGRWKGIDNTFGSETVTIIALVRGTHQP